MSKVKTWKITGSTYRYTEESSSPISEPLPELFIEAETFDKALAAARKINPWYNGGQVVE